MFDPSNHAIKPNFLYRASELHVPGPASLSWEIAAVPHGEIHHHFYKSGVVGDQSRLLCLHSARLRPAAQSKRIPSSICCNGSATDASAWTAVGRANVILDNLIAQGKAKPMIIVMPPRLRRARGSSSRNSRGVHDRAITRTNFN